MATSRSMSYNTFNLIDLLIIKKIWVLKNWIVQKCIEIIKLAAFLNYIFQAAAAKFYGAVVVKIAPL